MYTTSRYPRNRMPNRSYMYVCVRPLYIHSIHIFITFTPRIFNESKYLAGVRQVIHQTCLNSPVLCTYCIHTYLRMWHVRWILAFPLDVEWHVTSRKLPSTFDAMASGPKSQSSQSTTSSLLFYFLSSLDSETNLFVCTLEDGF